MTMHNRPGMTDDQLNAMLLTLIKLKFETLSPATVYHRMGPTWRRHAIGILRKAVENGDTPTIETLWGTPNDPKIWRLNLAKGE